MLELMGDTFGEYGVVSGFIGNFLVCEGLKYLVNSFGAYSIGLLCV